MVTSYRGDAQRTAAVKKVDRAGRTLAEQARVIRHASKMAWNEVRRESSTGAFKSDGNPHKQR